MRTHRTSSNELTMRTQPFKKVGQLNKTQVDGLVKEEMNVSTLSGVNDSDRFQVLSRIYQEQVKAARKREEASATEQTFT